MVARLGKLLFLALIAIALAVVAVVLAASAAAARTQEELVDGAVVSPAATAWLIIGLVALTAFLAGVGALAVRRVGNR